MSTLQPVTRVKRVEVTCSCGTKFKLRERDYQNRKKESGKEPSCSVKCGLKDRHERKVSIPCECGCGQMVVLSEGRLKARRTRGEKIFFSQACGKRLKAPYRDSGTILAVAEKRDQLPKACSCSWCDHPALYFNGLKGNLQVGACDSHYYKLSSAMIQQAGQMADQVAGQVARREEWDRWEKDTDDWFLDYLVVGKLMGMGDE